MAIFALIDCNNFYASCERAFNPALENKPIIILSNNDGCVIARSNQAKTLGIPMGAPYYQWRSFCQKNRVNVFSSNYALYGDMSNRIMSILRELCPDIEVYSIDEAFISLDTFKHQDVFSFALRIKKTIKQYTGIPVSIGISSTKTLAKIANHIAKKHTAEGIFDLSDPTIQENILANFPVNDVWGIGRKLSKKMQDFRIQTAKELRDADLKILRRKFSVVVEKTIQEMRGISCLALEDIQVPKKQILSSRSFGRAVTSLSDLEEAVSYYVANACLKLRQQKSFAKGVSVFLQTNFYKENRYSNSAAIPFSVATDNTAHIIHMAKKCLSHIYQPGYRYNKAGIMLFDLSPSAIGQRDLFAIHQTAKTSSLVETIDLINKKLGKSTVFYCAEGIEKNWRVRADYISPRFTTQWNELPNVICL